jgi:hypothetical protein
VLTLNRGGTAASSAAARAGATSNSAASAVTLAARASGDLQGVVVTRIYASAHISIVALHAFGFALSSSVPLRACSTPLGRWRLDRPLAPESCLWRRTACPTWLSRLLAALPQYQALATAAAPASCQTAPGRPLPRSAARH